MPTAEETQKVCRRALLSFPLGNHPRIAKWVCTLLKVLSASLRTDMKSLRKAFADGDYKNLPLCPNEVSEEDEENWNAMVQKIEQTVQRDVPSFPAIQAKQKIINKLLRNACQTEGVEFVLELQCSRDRELFSLVPSTGESTEEGTPPFEPNSPLSFPADMAGKIVAAFIGVNLQALSEKLVESIELAAIFATKRLAFELKEIVQRCQGEIHRLNNKLGLPIEVTDSPLTELYFGLRETMASTVVLENRLESFGYWSDYVQIAKPIHEELSRFQHYMYSAAFGYTPVKQRFEESLTKMKPAEQRKTFLDEIKQVLRYFDEWRDQTEKFYGKHCHMLR